MKRLFLNYNVRLIKSAGYFKLQKTKKEFMATKLSLLSKNYKIFMNSAIKCQYYLYEYISCNFCWFVKITSLTFNFSTDISLVHEFVTDNEYVTV